MSKVDEKYYVPDRFLSEEKTSLKDKIYLKNIRNVALGAIFGGLVGYIVPEVVGHLDSDKVQLGKELGTIITKVVTDRGLEIIALNLLDKFQSLQDVSPVLAAKVGGAIGAVASGLINYEKVLKVRKLKTEDQKKAAADLLREQQKNNLLHATGTTQQDNGTEINTTHPYADPTAVRLRELDFGDLTPEEKIELLVDKDEAERKLRLEAVGGTVPRDNPYFPTQKPVTEEQTGVPSNKDEGILKRIGAFLKGGKSS